MATYSIKAVKYCEQTVPGPQMFFMSRWDEWMVADFFFFILRRDDGQITLIDPGVRDVDEIQPLVVFDIGIPDSSADLCKMHVYAEGDIVWVSAIRPVALLQDLGAADQPAGAEASVVSLVDAACR